MEIRTLLILLFSFGIANAKAPPPRITTVDEAEKYILGSLDIYGNQTLYCGCEVLGTIINTKPCRYAVQNDREQAMLLGWEHVVPVETFGRTFVEWTKGSRKCKGPDGKRFKGEECARTNPTFARMEADLYNLFPESAELLSFRVNRTLGLVKESEADFGGCKMKVNKKKYEPPDEAKGIVARAYLNFLNRYPGRVAVTPSQKKMLSDWNKLYPVSKAECDRFEKIAPEVGYRHLFAKKCDEDKAFEKKKAAIEAGEIQPDAPKKKKSKRSKAVAPPAPP